MIDEHNVASTEGYNSTDRDRSPVNSVDAKIVEIRRRIGAIGKTSGPGLSYAYRSYETVYQNLQPLLDEFNLTISDLNVTCKDIKTYTVGDKPTVWFIGIYRAEFKIRDVGTGDYTVGSFEVPANGTGSSQTMGAAMSYGMKNWWIVELLAPSSDIEDPDKTHSTEEAKKSMPNVKISRVQL